DRAQERHSGLVPARGERGARLRAQGKRRLLLLRDDPVSAGNAAKALGLEPVDRFLLGRERAEVESLLLAEQRDVLLRHADLLAVRDERHAQPGARDLYQ